MNNAAMNAGDPHDYDIDRETAASRNMLEKRIPSEVNKIKLALVDVNKRKAYEPWRLALTVDLVDAIERNCEQLLETMDKDRLPAAAWIARNLLELLVWVKYCGVSRENTWRFHEDALRDAKGMLEAHAKSCAAMGIENETAADAAQLLQQVALEKLGLEDIRRRFSRRVDGSESARRGPGRQVRAVTSVLVEVRSPDRGPRAWYYAPGRSLPATAGGVHDAGRVLRGTGHACT
jgi:hypothetical protein